MKKLLTLALVAFTAVLALPSQAAASPAATESVSRPLAPMPVIEKPAKPLGLAGVVTVLLFGLGAVVGTRTLVDSNLVSTKALPAAAATNYSDSIDTNSTTPGRVEGVELSVTLPATPSLVDAKTITLTVEDSADNITFVALADLPPIVSTGAGGVGAAAIDRRFKLPINTRQYLRLQQDVLAAGGDNTAISSTLELVF